MMNLKDKHLFVLFRLALGIDNGDEERKPLSLSADEWQNIYTEAMQQSVLDVVFTAISKLSKEELPPKPLLVRWAAHAEITRAMNKTMNEDAAHLTEIFSKAGRRTAVLKGAANARLYPDPFSRQCGDIDIWVEGGRESVEALLSDLKMHPELEDNISHHHVHLPKNEHGIVVEVHYKPSSGIPFKNEKLQNFLNKEILKSELVPEGFYAPTIKFALVMQLSHLQQHFFSYGLGFRQYMDYFILLQHSSERDRNEAASVIKSLYMGKSCGAVMWLLGEAFGLDRKMMLCAPDKWRGKKLLKLAMEGGNFGRFAKPKNKKMNVFVRWIRDRMRRWSWIPFDPINVIAIELHYWRDTISLIPLRIKRRKISL